jgi:hypothetical protein
MNQESAGGPRLSLPPLEEIARQLGTTTSEEGTAEEGNSEVPDDDTTLAAMADEFVAEVIRGSDEGSLARQRRAVDEMGLELQQQAAHRSAMLDTPLRQLAHQGDEGGPVAKSLVELRERMHQLDPGRTGSRPVYWIGCWH